MKPAAPLRPFPLRLALVLLAAGMLMPMLAGLLCVGWFKLCQLVPIPGFLFAMVAIPPLALFSAYCWPVHAAFGRLCFDDRLLGDLILSSLPCDSLAWAGVALFYTLASLLLVPSVAWLAERF